MSSWYTADRKHIEADPDEAKVVKMLFTEGQKGLSLHKIADMMNEKGILTRRGKEWSAGSVQVVLRNSFYAGILTHQGKEIKGNHEPLISKVQFGKVQSQISISQLQLLFCYGFFCRYSDTAEAK